MILIWSDWGRYDHFQFLVHLLHQAQGLDQPEDDDESFHFHSKEMWQQRWWGWFGYPAPCCWSALLLQREGKVQICISNSFKQFKQHPAAKMLLFICIFIFVFVNVFVNCTCICTCICKSIVYMYCWERKHADQHFKLIPAIQTTSSSQNVFVLSLYFIICFLIM